MNSKRLLYSLFAGASIFLPVTYLSQTIKQSELWSWGFGRNGELGTGSQSNCSLPQNVKNIKFIDIDSKKNLCAGVTIDGKLFTWGKNRNGVLGHLPLNLNVLIPRQVQLSQKITQISCGYQHMVAITQKGQAYVWGLSNKKSGFRSIGTKQSQKSQIKNEAIKLNISNIKSASCSNEEIVLVDNNGKVFLVDNNSKITQLSLQKIKKVSSGINFFMALDQDGQVFVWGNNNYGQLGTGGLQSIPKPSKLQGLSDEKVIDISCGDNYSGAVTDRGEVFTWGFGNDGQLCHGDKFDQYTPRKLITSQKIRNIVCGGSHTALLTATGRLLLAGRGREGQLGRQQKDQSNSGYALSLKQVQQLPKDKTVKKVACGANHTLVLLQNIV